MSRILCVTFRFIHPFPLFHGRADGDSPEWPPSPMRAFQALTNAASMRTRGKGIDGHLLQSLQLLETIRPFIVAPAAEASLVGRRAYVPHNHADLVAAAWDRGNTEESIASHWIEKDIRPIRLDEGVESPSVHYLYVLENATEEDKLLAVLRPVVRSITSLGWGIDQVAADAALVDLPELIRAGTDTWRPSPQGGRRLRTPRRGSLAALQRRYAHCLNRLSDGKWTPVPPFSAMDVIRYRRECDPAPRPHVVFKLVDDNDDAYSHSQTRFLHLAGMARHAAIQAMQHSPPPWLTETAKWIESYVAGHRTQGGQSAPHVQFSYVPLPSIGHPHADPSVRRIMFIAPDGGEDVLEYLCRQLDGVRLQPKKHEDLRGPVYLSRIRKDNVVECYTRDATEWASFTPVILPGHDDHKPDKTRRLIEKALAQSGIVRKCEYEWSAYSQFPKAHSAHKYDRFKQVIGYVRPDHLAELTAVHLRLKFECPVPGPLVIGAGRHCGFGLMAAVNV